MTKSQNSSKSSLSEMARTARQAAVKGPGGDRTTLNVHAPEQQGGITDSPDALGESLVTRGVISRHQLFNALNESYHQHCTLREALLALGYVTEEQLAQSEG